jgi:hypothetical protein
MTDSIQIRNLVRPAVATKDEDKYHLECQKIMSEMCRRLEILEQRVRIIN